MAGSQAGQWGNSGFLPILWALIWSQDRPHLGELKVFFIDYFQLQVPENHTGKVQAGASYGKHLPRGSQNHRLPPSFFPAQGPTSPLESREMNGHQLRARLIHNTGQGQPDTCPSELVPPTPSLLMHHPPQQTTVNILSPTPLYFFSYGNQ